MYILNLIIEPVYQVSSKSDKKNLCSSSGQKLGNRDRKGTEMRIRISNVRGNIYKNGTKNISRISNVSGNGIIRKQQC